MCDKIAVWKVKCVVASLANWNRLSKFQKNFSRMNSQTLDFDLEAISHLSVTHLIDSLVETVPENQIKFNFPKTLTYNYELKFSWIASNLCELGTTEAKATEIQFELINYQLFHKLIKDWNLIRISWCIRKSVVVSNEIKFIKVWSCAVRRLGKRKSNILFPPKFSFEICRVPTNILVSTAS